MPEPPRHVGISFYNNGLNRVVVHDATGIAPVAKENEAFLTTLVDILESNNIVFA